MNLKQLREAIDRGDTITHDLEKSLRSLLDLVELQHRCIKTGGVHQYTEALAAYDAFNKEQ